MVSQLAYLNKFGKISCIPLAQVFGKVEAMFEDGVYPASPNRLSL